MILLMTNNEMIMCNVCNNMKKVIMCVKMKMKILMILLCVLLLLMY